MKILAIESSGQVTGAAIIEDDIMIGEYTLDYEMPHSCTLLGMVDALKEMTRLDLGTLDAIALSAGPGSFTGLRIGSATAKGLGLALDKPLIAVPTTEALSCNLWGCADLICPLMDARRGQTYTGLYEFIKDPDISGMPYKLRVISDAAAVGIENILSKISQTGRRTVFLGDGVPVFLPAIRESGIREWSIAPAHANRQRAGSVAYLAMQYMREGKTETAAEHRPRYLRLSQAERERAERLFGGESGRDR